MGFLCFCCLCCCSKCAVTERPKLSFSPGNISGPLVSSVSLSNLIHSLLTFAKELSALKSSFVCCLSVTHPPTSPSPPFLHPLFHPCPLLLISLCLHPYILFIFSSLKIPSSLHSFILPSLHPSIHPSLHPSILPSLHPSIPPSLHPLYVCPTSLHPSIFYPSFSHPSSPHPSLYGPWPLEACKERETSPGSQKKGQGVGC